MMVDKNAVCPTDGPNQKFRIIKDQEGRKSVSVSPPLTEKDLHTRLMVEVNVDDVCNDIFGQSFPAESPEVSFSQWINYLSEQYRTDLKFPLQSLKSARLVNLRLTNWRENLGRNVGLENAGKKPTTGRSRILKREASSISGAF